MSFGRVWSAPRDVEGAVTRSTGQRERCWRNMFREMDARPPGDRLRSLEIEDSPEMEACYPEKRPGYGMLVYESMLELLERVKKCLTELPKKV